MRPTTVVTHLLAPALWAGALLLPAAPARAQALDAEKFHDVSKKSRRGYLEDVSVDNKAGKIDLRFITKSTNKEIASQTYHFDTKYNLLGVDEQSIPLEKVKGYRGENYSRQAVTIGQSTGGAGGGFTGMASMFSAPAGTLIIQHKRIDYKWSWLGGGYRKSVKLLETEKPKTEAGGGFHVVEYVDNDATGGLLVLATENLRLGNLKAVKPGMHLLYFNDKAELVSDKYLDAENGAAFTLAEMAPVGLDQDENAEADDEKAPDVAIVLAYNKAATKAAKDLHTPTEYKYLRVSGQGEVKETIRMDLPVSAWLVSGFVPMSDNSVLVYGPANAAIDKYLLEAVGTGTSNQGLSPEENFKAKNFVLASIKGGKVDWVTKTDIKEFETKQQVPPGQKRTPDYTGKRFAINLASETPNGDIFIGGQNFTGHRGSNGGSKFLNTLAGQGPTRTGPTRTFDDLLLFHFDRQGHLRAQYGLRRSENNALAKSIATMQFMRASANGKGVYWVVQEMDGWRTVDGLTEDGNRGGLFDPTERETISYPSVTRIDLAAATIGPQKTFGVTKEGKYYLNNRHMTLPVGRDDQQVVFFGENKKGSTMWFAQMPLE